MRIKEYTSPISGDIAMLVDDGGMPLRFANRYVYSMIEKPGKSLSSVKQALFVISRLYLWAELRGCQFTKFAILWRVSQLRSDIRHYRFHSIYVDHSKRNSKSEAKEHR